MSGHMHRTTVRLEERLLDEAKREAARRGETLTALIEEDLRLSLAQSRLRKRKPVKLPVSDAKGGPYPGIDLTNSAALLEIVAAPE
jgi:hypothetical protein